jgi:hypothetical protein
VMFVHTLLIDSPFITLSNAFSFGGIGRSRGKLLYTNWHNEYMGNHREKNFTTQFIYMRVGRYLFDGSTAHGTNSTLVYEAVLE